ncbi:MAG: hypothetical protein FJ128_12010 [Deltaproteobacteria bacterium]|nr:hypothetical protein [Deltaproteobacteria bacterium]
MTARSVGGTGVPPVVFSDGSQKAISGGRRLQPAPAPAGKPVLLNPSFYFFEKDFSFMLLI